MFKKTLPPEFQQALFASISLLMAIGTLGSCSVKEDRTLCPSFLTVDCREASSLGGLSPIEVRGWEEKTVIDSTIPNGEDDEYRVPKGMVDLSAISREGAAKGEVSGSFYTVSAGRQMDSVYAYCSTVDCTGETAYDKVVLHKQFATVYMILSDKGADFSIKISGDYSGFDLLDLSAREGAFYFEPVLSDGEFVFRVPRQKSATLSGALYIRGELYDTLEIGKAIEESGYRWDTSDLQDIYLKIDVSTGTYIISINSWDAETITVTI